MAGQGRSLVAGPHVHSCAAGFGALLLPYHLAAAREILIRVPCLLARPLARLGRGDCLCPLLLRRLQLRPLLLLLPLVLAPLILLLLLLRLSLEAARHRGLDVFVDRHGCGRRSPRFTSRTSRERAAAVVLAVSPMSSLALCAECSWTNILWWAADRCRGRPRPPGKVTALGFKPNLVRWQK